MEHLQRHLVSDHTSANVQTPFKCRWKSCEEFFCARASSKQVRKMLSAHVFMHVWLQELTCVCVSQGLLVHMQKHAEEEADLEP